MRSSTLACAGVICVIALSLVLVPGVSAAEPAGVGIEPPKFSFSDLMGSWGSAMIDPATYTSWARIGGFGDFLMNETFLSALSSGNYSSLDRDSMLGTIPNIFFIVCILVAILSVGVAVVEIRKLEASRRVIKKN